jgi:hypothetical protein
MWLNRFEDVVQDRLGCRSDEDASSRRFFSRLADAHVFKVEGSPHHEDEIQHLGQDERINDVTLKNDSFFVAGHGLLTSRSVLYHQACLAEERDDGELRIRRRYFHHLSEDARSIGAGGQAEAKSKNIVVQ